MQLSEEKVSFEEKVIGVNNGGVFVNVEGIRAFCPGSHIPQVSVSWGMQKQCSCPVQDLVEIQSQIQSTFGRAT